MTEFSSHTRRRRGHRGHDRNYGRRRGDDRRRRFHSHSQEGEQREGGIISFFKKLFGIGKRAEASVSVRRSETPANGAAFSRPARLAEPVEVITPKLYVGNLSYQTSESDLFDLFSQVGSVSNVEIVRDRRSNSKGFGFVEMQSIETAKAAAAKSNGAEFMGRQLIVNGAKS